jgi:hypothetical protein
MDISRAQCRMTPLEFDSYMDMGEWIRANGPLPMGREVKVGARLVRPHTCTHGECIHTDR